MADVRIKQKVQHIGSVKCRGHVLNGDGPYPWRGIRCRGMEGRQYVIQAFGPRALV